MRRGWRGELVRMRRKGDLKWMEMVIFIEDLLDGIKI